MDNDILKIDCTTTIVLRNTRTNKVYKDESENKTLLKLFIIDFYTSRIEWALKEMHRDKNGNNLFFYKLLHSR